MTAICGVFGHTDPEIIKKMMASLQHRGRNSEIRRISPEVTVGIWSSRVSNTNFTHPSNDTDNSVQAVISGQIYNQFQLKMGHQSMPPDELVTRLYKEKGVEFLKELNGSFILALWDPFKKQLLVARDQFGEAALYYYRSRNGIICFASEIKALLASGMLNCKLSYSGLDSFLSFRCIPPPHTAIQSVYALKPGEFFRANHTSIQTQRYCSLYRHSPVSLLSRDEMQIECLHHLRNAVKRRTRNHKSLGLLLSGGIDSSVLASLLTRDDHLQVQSFTLGFEVPGNQWPFDERSKARDIADFLDIDHQEKVISSNTIQTHIPRFIWSMDQPTGDGLHHYVLYEFVREFADIAVIGTGGDELFGGYEWFDKFQKMAAIDKWLRVLSPVGRRMIPRLLPNSQRVSSVVQAYGSYLRKFALTNTLFKEEEKEKILTQDCYRTICESRHGTPLEFFDYICDQIRHRDPVAALTKILFEVDLPALLLRDTEMFSQAHDLTILSPFLDPDLAKFTLGIPARYKRNGSKEKIVLRQAAKGILPYEVIDRPKQGFFAPMSHWMRNELNSFVEQALSKETTRRRGLFDPESIWAMYLNFKNNLQVPFFKIWSLVVLELWQQHFIDQVPEISIVDPGKNENAMND